MDYPKDFIFIKNKDVTVIVNIDKSKNVHYIKEIFPHGFSLASFEKEFTQNQNIIKNDRNIVKILRLGEIETVTKSFKTPNFIQGLSLIHI